MYENIKVTPLGRQFANIIIWSTFDEVSHAIKKKSCRNIKTVTGPTG